MVLDSFQHFVFFSSETTRTIVAVLSSFPEFMRMAVLKSRFNSNINLLKIESLDY